MFADNSLQKQQKQQGPAVQERPLRQHRRPAARVSQPIALGPLSCCRARPRTDLTKEPADLGDHALDGLVRELRVHRQAEDLQSCAFGHT